MFVYNQPELTIKKVLNLPGFDIFSDFTMTVVILLLVF